MIDPQDEVGGEPESRVTSQAASQATSQAWNGLHTTKYSEFSVLDQFAVPGHFLPSADGLPREEDASLRRQAGTEAPLDGSHAHFDLLPDTGIASPALLDLDGVLEGVRDKPAWLSLSANGDSANSSTTLHDVVPETPGERGASRWFALKRIFHQDDYPEELPAERVAEPHIPCLAVFSLAGGVGKTSVVATLGRALSAHGERVLLVDTTSLGLLPFYFGARELRAAAVRTFAAPGSTDAPVNMVSLDLDGSAPAASQGQGGDWLVNEIGLHSRGASRILIDLATASSAVALRLMSFAPSILVPVTPDMNSVASLNPVESLFRNPGSPSGRLVQPFYLLNQFDPSLALHLDVREVMRQQLGDRLLPFTLRRSPAVSEAMAQGMTVMDYAPNSPVAEDYMTLAGWIRSIAAPATPGYRGVRWSERSL